MAIVLNFQKLIFLQMKYGQYCWVKYQNGPTGFKPNYNELTLKFSPSPGILEYLGSTVVAELLIGDYCLSYKCGTFISHVMGLTRQYDVIMTSPIT